MSGINDPYGWNPSFRIMFEYMYTLLFTWYDEMMYMILYLWNYS